MREIPCKCDEGFYQETTTLNKWRNGELFIIEDVPLMVCRKCGDRYFEGKVMEKIEEMMKTRSSIDRQITVPVMKYKVA
ncbi:MAG: YgiT-type zinc finger protein [Candidatus Eremiobacteraeota bacterium]|nr:YgiT-type zinc finger protein [Candidatus Eremiobacteraeota bacterium]